MTQPPKKQVNQYLKYSGLAFQLAGLVLAGLFGGQWLDKTFHLDKPYFTIGLVVVLFSGFLYKLYLDLNPTK